MSRISDKIKNARMYAGVKFRQSRLFVPVDCQLPTTAKETLGRQLLQAGIINQQDFETMLGVVYDVDVENPDEENFDDEAFSTQGDFIQSSLAEYEDFRDIDDPPRPSPEQPASVSPDKADVRNGDAPEPAPEPAPEGAPR